MTAEELERKAAAGRAARIAAYGSADARTPADMTWREIMDEAQRRAGPRKPRNFKRYLRQGDLCAESQSKE